MLIFASFYTILGRAWHETPGIDNHTYHRHPQYPEPSMPTRALLLSFLPGFLILALVLSLGGGLLEAAQYSGSVRAADQPVPGAMVTAKQGDTKVIAYTDETSYYSTN